LGAKEAALAEGLNAHAEAAGGVEAQAVLGLHLPAELLQVKSLTTSTHSISLPLSLTIYNMCKL